MMKQNSFDNTIHMQLFIRFSEIFHNKYIFISYRYLIFFSYAGTNCVVKEYNDEKKMTNFTGMYFDGKRDVTLLNDEEGKKFF